MSSIINTNISSLNAQRNLSTSQTSLSTSLQRLSSGLRINSAKDDAAGLSITARMTSQIKGMDQAVRNANDAISLSQTAEGALSETTNLLQRMRELSIQSANATNSAGDRKSLQSEVNQLKSELDRIANTTNFNGNKLLDGSFVSQNFQVGADSNQTIGISISGATGTILGVNSLVTNNVGGITAATGSGTPSATTDGTGMGTTTAGTSATAALTTALPTQTITVTDSAGATTTHAITAGGTSASAFAVAASLTGGSGVTSATAAANSAVLDFSNTTVDVGDTVSFNLVGDDASSGVTVSFTSTGQSNLKADAMTAIGLITMPTGVTAAAGTGNTINLASSAGHNIGVENFAVSNAASFDLDGFTGFNATNSGTLSFVGAGANAAFNASYTFTISGQSVTATIADGGTAAAQTGSVALTGIKDQSAASANARTFDLTVNGTTQAITVSNTNFADSAALAANVQTQINSAFGSGVVTVGVDGSDFLTLTTAAKGANAAITVAETGAHTGATALFGGPLAIANGTGTVSDTQVATAFRTAIIGASVNGGSPSATAVASGAFTVSLGTQYSGAITLSAMTQGVFKGTTDITANISAASGNTVGGAGAGTWAAVSGAINTLTATNTATLNVGGTAVSVDLTGIRTDAAVAAQKAAIATAFDTGLTAASVAHTATIAGAGSHIALTGLTGATGSKVFTGTSTGSAGSLTITNTGNTRGTTASTTNNGTLTFDGADSETYTNAYVGTVQFGAAAGGTTLTEGASDSAVKTSTVDIVLAAGATVSSSAASSVFNAAANTNVGSVTGLTSVSGGNNVAAQTLTIVGTSSATVDVAVDATAKNIAAAVNAQSATTAVTAKATTSATLSNLSANGTVSFSLYGSNTTAVAVSATVTTGDLTSLAKAINDKTGNTGITATLSSAGTSISLANEQGYNIGIENFTHSASTGSVEQNLRVTGTSGDSVTLRNGNSTTGDSTVIGGKVTFSSSESSFSVQSSIAASAGGLFTGSASSAQASSLSAISTIDVSTAAGAQSAIDVIDGALSSVNSIRASLGALQNRFTSTISSLQTTSENITSARSRIQDADFASETASLTRGQILQQAGTAMLAQANSLPNGVLALLRG